MDWNIRHITACILVMTLFSQLNYFSQATTVKIEESNDGFSLLRDGKPYYVKGAGTGAGSKDHFNLLSKSGANSIRLWSTNNESFLDSAKKYNMSVTLGLYVRPERSGMNYNDQYAVQGQIEQLKTEILRFKDHPSLLIWGIGNEVDLRYSNFKVWETIEEIAKFIKKVDPHHPTMTVIAGIDPAKLFMIKKYCPSIDILGLNVYGAIQNAPLNIRKFNWNKPYIISEWGVNGPFEAQTTSWKAKIEPPNGIKAQQRIRRYTNIIETDKERCLGSYCFLWGQKQESTATWHGMFLNNGAPTEAIDAMHFCWKKSWPDQRAPSIVDIHLNGIGWKKDHILGPSSKSKLVVNYEKYDNSTVELEYHLYPEAFTNKIGGDRQISPDEIKFEIVNKGDHQIEFIAPKKRGAYRIFAFVKNEHNQYSVANIPFVIE